MEGLVAVGGFQGPGPLQVETGVVLVSHAYAAVHLDQLPRDEMEVIPHPRLGEGGHLCHVAGRRIIVDAGQRRLRTDRANCWSVNICAAR